jgi:hypothetical protein
MHRASVGSSGISWCVIYARNGCVHVSSMRNTSAGGPVVAGLPLSGSTSGLVLGTGPECCRWWSGYDSLYFDGSLIDLFQEYSRWYGCACGSNVSQCVGLFIVGAEVCD